MTAPSADTAHLRETLLRREEVFQGQLLHVYADAVQLPDGREAQREVVHHRGAVGIVPVTAAGRVILVRQWRHAMGRALWEVPAGTRDGDEEPLATARRELREETGYTAETWQRLGAGGVSPGYSDELLTFFRAEGLRAGETDRDPDELLDVADFDPAEVITLLSRAETDLKTVAALALAGLLPSVPARG